jgi:hypothetical protein
MAKDIEIIKGINKITISQNNLAHYESLGYKVVGKQEIVKPKITKEEKDNKEKKWR